MANCNTLSEERSFVYLWVYKNDGKFTATTDTAQLLCSDCVYAATKGGDRAAHGKQASHFTIRYVVVQCCHYQRSVAAVLENVLLCSERVT